MTERDPTILDTSPSGDEAARIWDAVLLARAWLDEHNGTAQPEIGLRVLKIVEEAGEPAAAWIGVMGNNPRKGVTPHTEQDVADELGDVAFTALVAAANLGHDPREVLAGVARTVRAPDSPTHPAAPGRNDRRRRYRPATRTQKARKHAMTTGDIRPLRLLVTGGHTYPELTSIRAVQARIATSGRQVEVL